MARAQQEAAAGLGPDTTEPGEEDEVAAKNGENRYAAGGKFNHNTAGGGKPLDKPIGKIGKTSGDKPKPKADKKDAGDD